MLDDEHFDGLPKVLLMGLRKSGKTSIQKVVFDNMQPHESTNLRTTVQPEKSTVKSNEFVKFEVWDFPGQNDPLEAHGNKAIAAKILENCGAIVFVMDCTELIDEATKRLIDTVCAANLVNPELCVEVFIHKVDTLNEEQQSDLLNSVRRTVEDAVKQRQELKMQRQLRLNFNLTSIYDHSVFQAFSLVVQKLIRSQLPYVMELLAMLNSNSSLDLSYLFLTRSKIYIAVDERNRQRARTYDLCSDAIDMMVRVDGIYGSQYPGAVAAPASSQKLGCSTIHLSSDDVIYVRELPNELTLVMMVRDEHFHNKALIDYNVNVFGTAVAEIFKAGGGSSGGAKLSL